MTAPESSRTFLVAVCDCKEEAYITPGLTMGDARAELERDGWRFAGQRWRCATCHSKWTTKKSMQKWARGREQDND